MQSGAARSAAKILRGPRALGFDGDVRSQTETEIAAPSDPLSQGDIFEIEWPRGQTGPKLGVIVNADCDLAHSKTDGVVALAPIYSFNDYLAAFWAPNHVAEAAAATTSAILKLIGDTDAEALQTWLASAGVDAVAERIIASQTLKPRAAQQLRNDLEKLAVCLDKRQSAIDRFKALCALTANPAKHARSQLSAAKSGMGDGHFFVSDLVGHAALGFVVRLRRVHVIAIEDVFKATSDQRSQSDGERPSAVRVGRFTPLYRFRVLQLFAQQYSRVGLPDELSTLSELAVEDLVVAYTGVCA